MEEVTRCWFAYKGAAFLIPSPKDWTEVMSILMSFNSSTKDIGGPELPVVSGEREKPRRLKSL